MFTSNDNETNENSEENKKENNQNKNILIEFLWNQIFPTQDKKREK